MFTALLVEVIVPEKKKFSVIHILTLYAYNQAFCLKRDTNSGEGKAVMRQIQLVHGVFGGIMVI